MWGKLLLLSVLACAVFSPVLSLRDNEETNKANITMGKSGPVCTKQGRRCIAGAECVNHHCRCPQGQKGQGQIECVDKAEHLCAVFGDPHIIAFGGAKSAVPLPCRFRAARFVTNNTGTVSGHGYCSFEVFVTSELLRGHYVARSTHIAVGIGDYAQQVHGSFHVYKTNTYDVNDTEVYNYQARTTSRDSIWGSTEEHLGLNIQPDFDDVNNFALLEIPQCGTRIKYRAFDRRRAKHQKQLPGVTIQAPGDAVFVDNFGNYPVSVCGQPSDLRSLYKDRAAALGFPDDKTALLYDVLSDKPDQQDNIMAGKCQQAFSLFDSSNDRINDINSCGFVLTEAAVGICIEEIGRHPFDIFMSCMAGRQGDNSRCTGFARVAAACSNTKGWIGPARINCPALQESTTEPPEPEKWVF